MTFQQCKIDQNSGPSTIVFIGPDETPYFDDRVRHLPTHTHTHTHTPTHTHARTHTNILLKWCHGYVIVAILRCVCASPCHSFILARILSALQSFSLYACHIDKALIMNIDTHIGRSLALRHILVEP